MKIYPMKKVLIFLILPVLFFVGSGFEQQVSAKKQSLVIEEYFAGKVVDGYNIYYYENESLVKHITKAPDQFVLCESEFAHNSRGLVQSETLHTFFKSDTPKSYLIDYKYHKLAKYSFQRQKFENGLFQSEYIYKYDPVSRKIVELAINDEGEEELIRETVLDWNNNPTVQKTTFPRNNRNEAIHYQYEYDERNQIVAKTELRSENEILKARSDYIYYYTQVGNLVEILEFEVNNYQENNPIRKIYLINKEGWYKEHYYGLDKQSSKLIHL